MKQAYLNGKYIAPTEAKVSVYDRGFLFSDGVYEVIPVYNNLPFLVHEHLKRLNDGLKSIKISFNCMELYDVCFKLIEKNKLKDSYCIYIQITRGEQKQRDHRFINISAPTVYAGLSYCTYPQFYNTAYKALLKKDIRWDNCSIKSISLLPNVLYKQQAEDAGCIECIMEKDNLITEASTSNVWIVKNKKIKTPIATQNILNGITRMFLINCFKKENLDFVENNITINELFEADEVWITSSTKEIQPIVKINNNIIADEVGPIYKKAIEIFNTYKAQYYDAKKYL